MTAEAIMATLRQRATKDTSPGFKATRHLYRARWLIGTLGFLLVLGAAGRVSTVHAADPFSNESLQGGWGFFTTWVVSDQFPFSVATGRFAFDGHGSPRSRS